MRHFLHRAWRILKPILEVAVGVIGVVALMLIGTLGGSSADTANALSAAAPAALATTGPLPGDLSAIPNEESCMQSYVRDPANNYANYPPVIGAPEHADAIHSGVNSCATFTGQFSGKNQVYQYQSQSQYLGGIGLVVFGGPDAAYLEAGGLTGGANSGQYVSRFDPSTGAELWRTYLTNANVNGQWLALGSMAVMKDGTIGHASGTWVQKLDQNTGEILVAKQQPIKGMPATDANFDGFTIAPDKEGTILLKTQTRSPGCPTQGNSAMSSCTSDYGPQPNTNVVAVDPQTLDNIASIELNQEVTARPIVTTYKGKIYLYIAGSTTGIRIIWDPDTKTLTQDTSWAPKYLLKGQAVGDAPALIGKWVLFNVNAAPGTVPICAVAVSQDDPNDLQRMCPWGSTLPSGVSSSESPGSFGTDPANNMFYMQDWLVGGVFGVSLDQSSGKMKVVWSRPDWRTSDYFSLVGSADKRILISQYIEPDWSTSKVPGYNYTEGVIWVDAATGKTIAQSAYNASTALGSLINLGYGGRLYTMGNQGSLFIYQVASCSDASPTAASPPSVTNCSTDYSSLPQPTESPPLPPQPSG